MKIFSQIAIVVVPVTLSACAPAGYHYETGSFTPTPNAQTSVDSSKANQPAVITNQRNLDWRSFPGDIETWSGIPPLPSGASASRSAKASAHCTVSDAAGHQMSAWMSADACKSWIFDAQSRARSGPTAAQVLSYRIEQCTRRLAASGYIQTYSGEMYSLCARMPQQ